MEPFYFVASWLRGFVAVSCRRPGPGELFQILHRRHVRRAEFVGVVVAQLVEGEGALRGDFGCACYGVQIGRVAAVDFVERAQVALGVGEQAAAGFGERALLADAREHVLEVTPLGNVVVHVVGGDEGDVGLARQVGEVGQLGFVGEFAA